MCVCFYLCPKTDTCVQVHAFDQLYTGASISSVLCAKRPLLLPTYPTHLHVEDARTRSTDARRHVENNSLLLQIYNAPNMSYALCTCMSRTNAMQMPQIIMNAIEAAAVDHKWTPAK